MAEELGSLVAKLGADLTDLKRGLLEGKAQLAGFQDVVEQAGAKVKQALSFVGIGVGLYEIVAKLKEFGASILDVGGKSELLRASALAIGQHYAMSAGSIDFYIQKLKEAGIEQERSLQAINSFLKVGISIDFLPKLAESAKVLGASMGLPVQEAFSQIISGIVKGAPRQLAEIVPGIKQVMASMSSDTKKLLDSNILSGTERAEILMNAVLAMADKAKGAATRYLSPGAGGEVSAREVVARYLAAVEETPGQGEALAAFRFTRKAGQDLGAFCKEVETRGWDGALEERGLAPPARGAAELPAPGLAGVLAGSGGGLEEAVVRTALGLVIREAWQSRGRPEAAKLVRQFLVTAVHLRLALDLGEPLEAAAGGYGRLRDGLGRIKALIEAGAAAAGAASETPATSGDWQGLTGWTWVTEVMAGLMEKLGR